MIASRLLALGVAAALLAVPATAQEQTFPGVAELLQASALPDGARVRVRRAAVQPTAPVRGGALRDMDELAQDHSFGWQPALVDPRLEDPYLEFRVGAPGGQLRVRLVTRAYYDDGDGELVESEVRHAPLRPGNLLELRGRLLRQGSERLLFVEPVLGSDGVHADRGLRVFGNQDGSALRPVLLEAVYGATVAKPGATVTLQGYFLTAGTRLRAAAGAQGFDLGVQSVNAAGTRLVALLPLTMPHGAAVVRAAGGQGEARIGALRAPEITRVTPARVRAGERIVIEGRALTSLSELDDLAEDQPTIRMDDVSNLRVVELSATRIVAELSIYEDAGSRELVIRHGGGEARARLEVEAALGPVIARVEEAGAYLLLRGDGFGQDPRVTFTLPGVPGEVQGEVVLADDDAVLVRRPAGATQGTVRVVGGVLDKAGPPVPFGAAPPAATAGLVGGLPSH